VSERRRSGEGALSCPLAALCPLCTQRSAGQHPLPYGKHSQFEATPRDAGAGRSPGAEPAAAAWRRRYGRSRAGAAGGSGTRAAVRRDAAVPGCGAGRAGRGASGCAGLLPAGLGLRGAGTALASVHPASFRPRAPLSFLLEEGDFLNLLLVFFSAVAVSRAQVQQEPSAETSEGTAISITCSHPNIQSYDSIYWYRQFPGRGPAFLVSAFKGSKEVPDPAGWLSVSADRRSSALRLSRPGLRDAAVYYCALDPREAKPGLRPGRNGGGRHSSARRGRCRCWKTFTVSSAQWYVPVGINFTFPGFL